MRKPVAFGPIRRFLSDNETQVFRTETLVAGVLLCLSIYLAVTVVSRLVSGSVRATETVLRIAG